MILKVVREKKCFKYHPAFQKTNNKPAPLRSKLIARKETFEACSAIHGNSSATPEPIIEGMLDALTSKFEIKQISDSRFSGKQTGKHN